MIDFTNKKRLIAGAGKSGIAAAKLLSESHAVITIYDANAKNLLTGEEINKYDMILMPGDFVWMICEF